MPKKRPKISVRISTAASENAKLNTVMFSAIALVLLAADTVRMVRELTAAKRNGVGQAAGEFDSAKIYKVAIVLAMTTKDHVGVVLFQNRLEVLRLINPLA